MSIFVDPERVSHFRRVCEVGLAEAKKMARREALALALEKAQTVEDLRPLLAEIIERLERLD